MKKKWNNNRNSKKINANIHQNNNTKKFNDSNNVNVNASDNFQSSDEFYDEVGEKYEYHFGMDQQVVITDYHIHKANHNMTRRYLRQINKDIIINILSTCDIL